MCCSECTSQFLHWFLAFTPSPHFSQLQSFISIHSVEIERLIHNAENRIRLARMRSEDMPPAAPLNLPIIVNMQPLPALIGTSISTPLNNVNFICKSLRFPRFSLRSSTVPPRWSELSLDEFVHWTRLPSNHGPDLVPGSNILARYRFYSDADAAAMGHGYQEIGTNLGRVLVCLRLLSPSLRKEYFIGQISMNGFSILFCSPCLDTPTLSLNPCLGVPSLANGFPIDLKLPQKCLV